jgi:hypothetical protein
MIRLFQRRGKRGWGNDPLVDPKKTVLPLRNIKLRMLNFVKARMEVFDISKTMSVSRINDEKTEDTIFVSPCIKILKVTENFNEALNIWR